MSTTENNKLIAEFMGFIECNKSTYQCCFGKINRVLPPQYMEFNTDWNWLMEVVDKIENLQYKNNNDVFKIVIDYGSCIIYNMNNDLDVVVSINSSTKIDATYNACVEFIKWYKNENN